MSRVRVVEGDESGLAGKVVHGPDSDRDITIERADGSHTGYIKVSRCRLLGVSAVDEASISAFKERCPNTTLAVLDPSVPILVVEAIQGRLEGRAGGSLALVEEVSADGALSMTLGDGALSEAEEGADPTTD